jgi:hypothetical protein
MRPLSGRARRMRDAVALAVVIAVLALWLTSGWGLTAEICFAITVVVCTAWLGYLAWALATGRVGLSHWQPTARRQRRLEHRAAEADAAARQQRLDAALGRGPYRPQAASPADEGPAAQARRELLAAVEQYGGLSPQARAAAEKIRRDPS